MALFQYTAIGATGKKARGVIDADSLQTAKERLLKQRVMVIDLIAYKEKKRGQVALKSSEILDFTRDLLSLLKAGLPLYESLTAIVEKYIHHKAHPIILDLADKVKEGHALSFALSQYPKNFNQLYIAMVSAGEESGSLEHVFDELAKLIARQERLKKQMISALIYPAFLGAFCLLVLCGLFFFVIPSMQELYEGRQLHPMTSFVLGASLFLKRRGALIALVILGGGAISALMLRRESGKLWIKRQLLTIPFIKETITQSVLVRFCRAFSVLLISGVEYVRAIDLSKKVMNHPLFEQVIDRAMRELLQGKKISVELAKSALIPPLVSRMLSMAEETGSAAKMLGNIADIYEEGLEKNLTRFTTLLQPIILLILGLIVGVVLLSVLLPLTDVSSFVM